MLTNILEQMKEKITKLRNGDAPILPGTREQFTEACTRMDRIWQGDVAFTIKNREDIPHEYVKWDEPPANLQLVHGSDIGSMHCLDSIDGVEAYIPQNWNAESMKGPFLILTQDREGTHPKHGNVGMLKNTCVHITYARELDREQRISRAKD